MRTNSYTLASLRQFKRPQPFLVKKSIGCVAQNPLLTIEELHEAPYKRLYSSYYTRGTEKRTVCSNGKDSYDFPTTTSFLKTAFDTQYC